MAVVKIEDEMVIRAPVESVWHAIADPDVHSGWHPFVTEISGEHRLGATRTCSVLVGKRTGQTEERCVVDRSGEQMAWAIEQDSTGFGRMVSEWTAGFSLQTFDAGTVVTAESSFRPGSIMIRPLMPFVRRRFHQTQKRILAALKASVESVE